MFSAVCSFVKKHANAGSEDLMSYEDVVKEKMKNLNIVFECYLCSLYLAWCFRTNHALGIRN